MLTTNSTSKEIKFDRTTKDWAMYLNGEYVGSCSTPQDAQAELDRLATAQLAH